MHKCHLDRLESASRLLSDMNLNMDLVSSPSFSSPYFISSPFLYSALISVSFLPPLVSFSFHLFHSLSLPAFLWPPFSFFPPFPARYFLLFLFFTFHLFKFVFPLSLISMFVSIFLSLPVFPFLSVVPFLSYPPLLFLLLPFPNHSFSSLSFLFFFYFPCPLFLPLHFLHSPLFLSYFLSRLLTLQLDWNTWLTWQMKTPNACHSYFSIPHPLAFIACPQHRSIHLLTKWWGRAALSAAAAAAHGESSIHLGPNCVNISFSLNGQKRLEL